MQICRHPQAFGHAHDFASWSLNPELCYKTNGQKILNIYRDSSVSLPKSQSLSCFELTGSLVSKALKVSKFKLLSSEIKCNNFSMLVGRTDFCGSS
jgi:hypothetical protein